jgi:hypothetical protein
MSFERQVSINPNIDDSRVELMFDFDELSLLMNDFKTGFKTTENVEKVKGPTKKGGGYNYEDKVTSVRDYNYYRNNELWGRIADELDIDMDDDDFDDKMLSEMYAFAYDQNEEYENPTFNDPALEFDPYVIDDDDNPDTPGVVPLMDISYTNKYSDAEKAKKYAFNGNQYKIGDSMSLNFDAIKYGYPTLASYSGNPEDSNFNGNTNSLYT